MKKCVILESNEEFAAQLKELLQKDYDVVGIYDDGAEGLSVIEREQPQIVVLGLLLKNIDGFTVVSELRARKNNAQIVASGNIIIDKDINQLMTMGVKYYFVKPVAAEIVVRRVKEVLSSAETEIPAVTERKQAGSLEERISSIFLSIGIPPHIKGYRYLREGIRMTIEEPTVINNVTKVLYPNIAKKYDTSASKVERAIRHAIEVGWNRGKIEAINAIFGARVYLGSEKPTNSEFIALIADKLILDGFT